MRRIIYSLIVSLDGFVEGPDGELDWSTPSEELHKHFNDLYVTGEIDTSLYGRKLYEEMAAYWPHVGQNGPASDVEVEFANAWKELPKIVFSTTLEEVNWNSRLVREVIPDEIRELKSQPGADIDVGGAHLASTFMRLGLVDEYRLYVQPVILGGGKRMFPPDFRHTVLHRETRTFEGGTTLLRYVTPEGNIDSGINI